MTGFAVTRNLNGNIYYLEEIYPNNKIVWITSFKDAFIFDNERETREFISEEFPDKDYYPSTHK